MANRLRCGPGPTGSHGIAQPAKASAVPCRYKVRNQEIWGGYAAWDINVRPGEVGLSMA
jgi:hypothetical protein